MASAPVDTPLMRQYLEIKQRYPDATLLFRLGRLAQRLVPGNRALELNLRKLERLYPDVASSVEKTAT